MDVKIIVATHKEYTMPKEEYYLLVFVGSAISEQDLPYQRDDEGDNISNKNRSFCELTGLYWAYKNLKADYIGLCHYRRRLDLSDIDISNYDVVLPGKRHYYIETVYSQFKHAHGSEGLDKTREVIERDYPEYLESFDRCMQKRSLHIFNIFAMRYDIFLSYCDFLFNLLFKIEDELGEVDRLYGYISERLLDVFLDHNKITYKEVPLIETEPVDWFKKISAFLKRKYRNR